MFVKKNGILYNLNQYAKVFPDKDSCNLLLADVQGDFDIIKFNSKEDSLQAFKRIIKILSKEKKKKEDNILDLDNTPDINQERYYDLGSSNIWANAREYRPEQDPSIAQDMNNFMRQNRETHEGQMERNPWEDLDVTRHTEPPIGVSREEWEEINRPEENVQATFFNPESLQEERVTGTVTLNNTATLRPTITLGEPMREAITDEVRETTEELVNRVNILEEEHNNIIDELRERNNLLQDQIFTLRDRLNRLTEQRDNIEDDTGYGTNNNTWDL